MPVATANGKKFTFPEGTTPEQMGQAIDEYFSGSSQLSSEPKQQQITRGGGRSANAARIANARNRIDDLRVQADAGQITSQDLSQADMDSIQKARIADIPEITGSFRNLSENLGFMQALGGMTAFDPDEFGKILTAADPNIGIVTTPDGERIAVNNQTKEAMSVNKLGPSLMDAIQLGGAAAAFSPAGALKTVGQQAVGGMVTQAAIEAGQQALGGDFDAEEVAIAAAAPVVMNKAAEVGKKVYKSTNKAVNEYFSNQAERQAKALSDDAGSLTARTFKESAKKAEIRQALDEGTVEAVGYTKNAKGKIVPNKLERDLVRDGVNDTSINAIKRMEQGDRQASIQMVKKARDFIRGKKGSETDLPRAVIGNRAMKRFNTIKKFQNEAQKKITSAVDRDLKGRPVDVSDLVEKFKSDLGSLRITEKADGGMDFTKSIATGNVSPLRKSIIAVDDGVFASADELHRVKQSLDQNINYENPFKDPLDKRAQDAIRDLRKGINERLRAMSSDYAKANDEFSKAAESLVPFAKAMGRKFDPQNDRVESLVGQELRKTISNYGNSNEMIEAIGNLDEAARKLGGSFDEDLMTLVMVNSELERLFGTFTPNGMQGVIEKGTGIAMENSGLTGRIAKEGLDIVKDKVTFTPPSKEKLRLLNQIETLISQQRP